MYEEEKYKINNNYIKYYLLYLILINAIFYICLKIYHREKIFNPYSPKITKIKIGDGKSAKIGIISDFQLHINNTSPYFKYYAENVYKALKVFKKNNIDVIIIAGDTTNNGNIINYIYFKQIYYSVYDEIRRPILISLMGNHDFYDMTFTKDGNKKKFFDYMNSYPYSHYLINDYNFIFWSSDNRDTKEKGIENYIWINSTIEKAKTMKKRNDDPIFVFTHIPPKKTVYGSEDIWGHQGIFNFLKNYQDVICISGHSHYSLRNTKSIWQGEFTTINTQGLSYIDLDETFQNAWDVRIDSAQNDSMGLIAYLNEDNVIFDRIEFSTEEVMEERWTINFPIKPSEFIYTFDKRNKKIKPIFNDGNGITIEKIEKNNILKNFIVFNAAKHEDYVYDYKIVLKKKENNFIKEYYYYSDYYKNKKLRKEILKFELPQNLSKGQYDVEIFAIDSFDNISEPKKGIIVL